MVIGLFLDGVHCDDGDGNACDDCCGSSNGHCGSRGDDCNGNREWYGSCDGGVGIGS